MSRYAGRVDSFIFESASKYDQYKEQPSIFIAHVCLYDCVCERVIVGKFVCFLTVFYRASRNQHTVIHHHSGCG